MFKIHVRRVDMHFKLALFLIGAGEIEEVVSGEVGLLSVERTTWWESSKLK